VLQGSLISPILFNLYINELLILLSKELGDQNVYCYADDLMFVCLGKYSLGKKALELSENGELKIICTLTLKNVQLCE